ncbi:caspase family protein [Limibacter armeniacum]|uniref:caspase family protein n=1 Tax=Limibacter armeniacum TaxID=466084 RepID=UPI002FE5BA1F
MIKGAVVDEYGVQAVYINGIKMRLNEGNVFEVLLNIAIGENRVRIKASDINGNIAERELVITRRENDELIVKDEEGVNYLLTIGIDKYAEGNRFPELFNAVYDVQAFSKLLVKKYQFDKENVIRLYNQQATKESIIETLTGLVDKLQWNDNLIIYYSGHGIYNQILREGFWIPYDGKKSTSNQYQWDTYISNSFLLKIVKEMKAKHIFIIADACFAGTIFEDSYRGGSFEDAISKYRSRWGFTSGMLEPVSDGIMGAHSPFNQAMLKFFKNNEENKVAISDLIQFVKKDVGRLNGQIPRGAPLKNVGDEGGEFIFELKDDNKSESDSTQKIQDEKPQPVEEKSESGN